MEGLAWGVLRASLGLSDPGFCEQDVVWIFGRELLDVQHLQATTFNRKWSTSFSGGSCRDLGLGFRL